MLQNEIKTLKRLQPQGLEHSLRDKEAFDKFVKGYYRPKEQIEHLHQLVVYAILKEQVSPKSVRNSNNFETILVQDLAYYLKETKKIEPAFAKVCFYFVTRVLIPQDKQYEEIVEQTLRHIQNLASELTLNEIADALTFIQKIYRKDDTGQSHIKADLITSLEQKIDHLLVSGS